MSKVSGYGMRDLGTDISTRMEVCMYRTVAHLPPETLLRNEVHEARRRFPHLLHFRFSRDLWRMHVMRNQATSPPSLLYYI